MFIMKVINPDTFVAAAKNKRSFDCSEPEHNMRSYTRLLIIYLLFLLGASQVMAQTGKKFWFAAPDATSGHNDQPVFLNLSAYNDSAYVVITQPASPTFLPLTLGIPANGSQRIDMTPWLADLETTIADSVLTNGLYIQSSGDISVYYEIAPNNNTDIFSLKADNALGNRFMISAQTYWASAAKYTPTPYNQAIIVATEDVTSVTITPTNNVVGHLAGIPYTVILNRGETYMIKAIGLGTTDRFGGTEVTSDKPIAITIADDSIENAAYGGCKDIIGDQTIPIEQIGSEYILVKGFLGSNPDRIYILATEDNTNVAVNGGSAQDFSINKGQIHELTLSDPSVHLLATKDVYVMHVSGFGCEVGMAIVPSVYCTGSREISFVRSQPDDFYMVVYVPDGAQGAFEVNGDPNMLQASDFNPVPGTGGNWVAARKYFSNFQVQIGNNYRVVNSTRNFHFGIINGGSTTGCLYGYFTDFSGIETGPIYRY